MRPARIVLVLALVAALGLAVYSTTLPAVQPSSSNPGTGPQEPVTKFLFVGDNHGVNPVYVRILHAAAQQPYNLMVNLADVSENGTAEEFHAVHDLETSLPFPVLHVVGNHDIKADPTRATFERVFNPRYLSRNVGPVHVVILDNADRTVGFDAEELRWLEHDLAANRKPYTFICFHRPFGLPFANITGDDETPASRTTNDQLLALLRKYPPSYVLTAHLHTYLPFQLDLGNGQNVPALVSGGGGGLARAALGGPSKSYFHAVEITVTATGIEERVLPAPTS